jgi:D-alanyl-D-alanine endopeptidase (penicillin-binding protein 7)
MGGICLMLGGAVTGIVFALWSTTPISEQPVGATPFDIGLNDVRAEGDKDLFESDSALLWDSEAGIMKYEVNGFERRPIASLTKLMTAMVAIDYGIDLEQEMTILPEEYRIGGRLVLAPGETVTMRDLLHASLMGSANNATLALVRGTGIEEKEFIQAMNRKAIALGLEQTEFVDLTGLDFHNLSTAYEVARMAEAAWEYPLIAETTSKIKYQYLVGGSGREHTIVNTNNLMVDYGYELNGSKTGYLYEAGFCLAVRKVSENSSLVAIVLGSPSEWDSMSDARALLERP